MREARSPKAAKAARSPKAAKAGDETVRAAARTLQLLEAVSARGSADLASLQKMTGLPKPTIVRLLKTLKQSGYVRQVSRSVGYALTERVLRLSIGFTYTDRAVSAAREHLDFFTSTYKWPVGIATFYRGALRLRYSTSAQSPISTNIPSLGSRMPMLTTAHGHVYLAFCSSIERKLILETLRNPSHPESAQARDTEALRAMVRNVRAQGYALRSLVLRDRVGGIAAPILHDGNIVATVSMRYYRSAITSGEAVRQYLEPMKNLAGDISKTLERSNYSGRLK